MVDSGVAAGATDAMLLCVALSDFTVVARCNTITCHGFGDPSDETIPRSKHVLLLSRLRGVPNVMYAM